MNHSLILELTYSYCRKNICEHLHDLGFVQSSLNMIPKAQKTMKNRYSGFQKNKPSCITGHSQKSETTTKSGRKCLQTHRLIMELISRICKRCQKHIFFPFIFISWRLITLQYFSGFTI